jgi:metal-dependent hydrolase (beta-lactamase superfamily II)
MAVAGKNERSRQPESLSFIVCAYWNRQIVNTVKQAQKSAGTDNIYVIMGGFHH